MKGHLLSEPPYSHGRGNKYKRALRASAWSRHLATSTYVPVAKGNTKLGQHQWGREVYSPMEDGEGRLNICRTIIESISGGMLGVMAVCAQSSGWVRRRLTELGRAAVR